MFAQGGHSDLLPINSGPSTIGEQRLVTKILGGPEITVVSGPLRDFKIMYARVSAVRRMIARQAPLCRNNPPLDFGPLLNLFHHDTVIAPLSQRPSRYMTNISHVHSRVRHPGLRVR